MQSKRKDWREEYFRSEVHVTQGPPKRRRDLLAQGFISDSSWMPDRHMPGGDVGDQVWDALPDAEIDGSEILPPLQESAKAIPSVTPYGAEGSMVSSSSSSSSSSSCSTDSSSNSSFAPPM